MSRGLRTRFLIAAISVATIGTADAADVATKRAAAVAPVAYVAGPWATVFGGFYVGPDAYFGDAGAVFALNRNLNQEGWLFRVGGGAGHYTYNRTTTLEQSVNFQTGDAMIGYQTFLGATRLTGYLGANVEHHDNDDPLADVKGTKWGVKAQGEIFTPINDRLYLFALGNVSSAFSSYFVLGKVAYRITDGIWIGPEVAALGNDRFDAVRTGPFLAFDLARATTVIVSGGYSWDTRSDNLNDHSGGYGTIHLRTSF